MCIVQCTVTQCVPRNMTEVYRLEGCLKSLKLFAAFNFKLNFRSKILELKVTQYF